jgi:hypothetical protein
MNQRAYNQHVPDQCDQAQCDQIDRCLRGLTKPKDHPLTFASFVGRVPTMPSEAALSKLAALDVLMTALADRVS